MRHRLGLITAIQALALALAVPSLGEEFSELREMVNAQGEVIEQLRGELERVRAEQQQSRDRVLALEDEMATRPVSAGAAGGSGVTADYVDRRIQEYSTFPESRLFLSGYGSARFADQSGGVPSSFEVQFNPIFHFRLTDRLHFNAELELELDDGGETEIELEFATIDFLATDWLALSAGKFLTPFNLFGPKLHPQWINKMASRPLIYQKGKGIIGVIGDVGVMASGGAPLWNEDSKFNYAVYLTNGPKAADDPEPALEFENTPDENDNKTAGGRIGFLPIPNLEIGFSGMTGRTKEGKNGRFDLIGADGWYFLNGLELRGEYVHLFRDLASNLDKWGYYLQASYRLRYHITEPSGLPGVLGRFEPVVRWGQTKGSGSDNRQIAAGLNYWLFESVPLKFTYEFNMGADSTDRWFAQIAYGF